MPRKVSLVKTNSGEAGNKALLLTITFATANGFINGMMPVEVVARIPSIGDAFSCGTSERSAKLRVVPESSDLVGKVVGISRFEIHPVHTVLDQTTKGSEAGNHYRYAMTHRFSTR